MRSFRVLVNPASGGGKALDRVKPVAQQLRDRGADVQVVVSLGLDHSVEEVGVAVALGQTVVACGGDGMVASVAGAVIARDADFGIIPSGRGNDFARQLGLVDAKPETTARTLLEGTATPVDVITVGERVVLGSVYAGVDSLASEIVDRAHRLPGALQYPYAAVRSLLTYQPTTYSLTVDDTEISLDAFSIVIANSGYYGKGMHVAPSAVVDDGVLDVVVIPKASRLTLIRLMPKIYDGSHVDVPQVRTFRGRSVTISSTGDVVAYGDGERLTELPVTATVAPGALRVLVP
ncbi:YegS/Rv2252/BmrU family lipid kinase [Aeromicrobium sp.]|uniref:diacylglycerol/lipid kinase family protein n=1 Tax=Aeromicrobium sp. TaxID=1871063 RepID=UPI0028A791C3|nr:YegS/Rv2252/BmrU family lipid kinase [Aeromicrobium sp.]